VIVPADDFFSPYASVGTPASGGTYTITASATNFTSVTSGTVTVTQPTITLGASAPVGAGLHRDFSLSLSDPAPTGGLVVNLFSSNTAVATVPTSITVPAGQSSLGYRLSGVSAGTATITAAATGWGVNPTTGISVTVNTASLVLNGVATSRTTSSLANSIYIYAFTPACGPCDYFNADTVISFTVNSTTAGIVTVTPSVTVPADQFYSPSASVSTPTATGTYTITASATGFDSVMSPMVTVSP